MLQSQLAEVLDGLPAFPTLLLGPSQLMTSEFRESERATLQVVAEVSLLEAWLLQQHPSALHDPPKLKASVIQVQNHANPNLSMVCSVPCCMDG